MLKIEFDPSNTVIALAIGKALIEIGGGAALAASPVLLPAEVRDVTVNATFEREVLGQNNEGDTIGDNAGMGNPASAAGQVTTAAQTAIQSDGAGSVTTGKPTHDEKGVAFIPAICANAAKPFYASGPYKGQWKKGTKVDQAEYDRVYAIALAAVTPATTTGRIDASQQNAANVGQQTSVGQGVENSPASQVFQQTQTSNPIDETINEIPATPAEVFALYGELCAAGGAGVANQICLAHGLENGTLIFSRPDLAPILFRELTTQKKALVGAG